MIKANEGQIYTFNELEKILNQWEYQNKSFIVKNEDGDESTAMMHTFGGNWKSGDGILFYSNGEQHSADPEDEFELLKVIEI